jgi:hypothetical protein
MKMRTATSDSALVRDASAKSLLRPPGLSGTTHNWTASTVFTFAIVFILLRTTRVSHIANEARQLFKSVGSLDELTIHHCDLRPYFHSFLTATIVGFAKLQHARGMPFECVVICTERMPVGMEEGLKPWVGSVEHYDE